MQYDLTWAIIVFASMVTIAMFLENSVHVLGRSTQCKHHECMVLDLCLCQVSASGVVHGDILYSIAGSDDHFAINTSTGQIDLIKPFDREITQKVRLKIWATDDGNHCFVIVETMYSPSRNIILGTHTRTDAPTHTHTRTRTRTRTRTCTCTCTCTNTNTQTHTHTRTQCIHLFIY